MLPVKGECLFIFKLLQVQFFLNLMNKLSYYGLLSRPLEYWTQKDSWGGGRGALAD